MSVVKLGTMALLKMAIALVNVQLNGFDFRRRIHIIFLFVTFP